MLSTCVYVGMDENILGVGSYSAGTRLNCAFSCEVRNRNFVCKRLLKQALLLFHFIIYFYHTNLQIIPVIP